MRLAASLIALLAAAPVQVEAQQGMIQVLPPPTIVRVTLPSTCPLEPYPNASIRAMATGSTTLAFSMDSEGNLRHTAILRSAGTSPEHKLLDAASVRSLWNCRFPRPERTNVHYNVTFDWRLQEEPASGAKQ